jgi:ATP-binding cassette subfamily B protein
MPGVRENLLARPDATQQQMADATRAAHMHDILSCLPEDYDT